MRRIIFLWFYFGLAATLTVVRVRRPTIDASNLGVFGLEVDSAGDISGSQCLDSALCLHGHLMLLQACE